MSQKAIDILQNYQYIKSIFPPESEETDDTFTAIIKDIKNPKPRNIVREAISFMKRKKYENFLSDLNDLSVFESQEIVPGVSLGSIDKLLTSLGLQRLWHPDNLVANLDALWVAYDVNGERLGLEVTQCKRNMELLTILTPSKSVEIVLDEVENYAELSVRVRALIEVTFGGF